MFKSGVKWGWLVEVSDFYVNLVGKDSYSYKDGNDCTFVGTVP